MAKKKARRTRRVGTIQHDKVLSQLDAYAIGVREFYLSLRRAGFPVDQALGIVMDKAAYPDWLIPNSPDMNPPAFDPFEEDDDD